MTDIIFKKLPRLYLKETLFQNHVLKLSQAHIHYLVNVRRLRQGEHIRIFNGQDGEWLGELTNKGKNDIELLCIQLLIPQDLNKFPNLPEASLACAPLKKDPFEFLIEKITELGVKEIFPILSTFSEAHSFNLDKSTQHAIKASEQSERLDVPLIYPLEKLEKFLIRLKSQILEEKLNVYCLRERQGQVKNFFKVVNFKENALFLVGPEGGWSEAELEMMEMYAYITFVSFGPGILRAETAGILAIGLFNQLSFIQNDN